MKLSKLTSFSLAAALLPMTAQAAEYITNTPATDGYWSTLTYWKVLVSWNPYTGSDATELPTTNANSVSLNTKSLVVDGNYTTKGVYTNSGLSSGVVEMRGSGVDYDADLHSLTIDVANTYTNTTWSGKGAIQMRGASTTIDQVLTFTNGVISITDSANKGTSTAVLDLYSNSKLGTSLKVLNFEAPTTIKSTEHLRVYGYGDDPARNTVNFKGEVIAKNGDYWKDFSINRATANISNTFSVNKMTIENGVVNILQGSTTTANNTIKVGSGGTLNVGTALNAASAAGAAVDNVVISKGGYMNIQNTGSLLLSGGYTLIRLYGTLEINSAKNSVICSRYLRMCAGGKLILNSSNALKNSTTQGASIWLSENGDSEIVVNADNNLHGICFRPTTTGNNANVTITLGEECNLLTFDTLSVACDTTSGYLLGDNKLIFVNFKNNTIKLLSSLRDENELANISAEGFKDFRLEAADGGGYWLNATAVPEPATLAAIFGGLALALAIYRRRK